MRTLDGGTELKIVGTLGETLAGWRSASRTRIDDTRGNVGRQDFHLEATMDRRDLVDQARKLERTNPIAEGLLSRSVENIVGVGWPLQMLSDSPPWNRLVEERWKLWGNHIADVRGLSSWSQLLQLHQRGKMRDGDSFSLFLGDGALQAIESDQVSTPFGLRRKQVDGIDLDERGRPTHYHVITKPNPLQTTVRLQRSELIPADLIVPLSHRQRHGQTRGLTYFANSFWALEQIDGHIKASTVMARMAACMGIALHTTNKKTGLQSGTDGAGNTRRKLRLEPGFMVEMGINEKITMLDPAKPTQGLPDTVRLLALLAGIPFGMPLEISIMFWSGSNQAQARGALLQAYNVWLNEMADLERFVDRHFFWWLIREMELGFIPVRADALRHKWRKPAWKYLSPKDEVLADMAKVDANFCTLADVIQKNGGEYNEVIAKREIEVKDLEAREIPSARSSLTRDPMADDATKEKTEKPDGPKEGDDE